MTEHIILEIFLTALKHVTPDMQTHKNAALRAGPAPFKAPVVSNTHRPVSAPKPAEKTPTLYKDGKKWIVVSGIETGTLPIQIWLTEMLQKQNHLFFLHFLYTSV